MSKQYKNGWKKWQQGIARVYKNLEDLEAREFAGIPLTASQALWLSIYRDLCARYRPDGYPRVSSSKMLPRSAGECASPPAPAQKLNQEGEGNCTE